MIVVQLTNNKIALLDDDDADLAELTWKASSVSKNNHQSYAVRKTRKNGIYSKLILLHRLVLERVLERPLVEGEIADHINNDALDNRRDNLRLADAFGNARNAQIGARNNSGAKGVSWRKQSCKWRARIRVNYKLIHLGDFEKFEDAVEAYNNGAEKYYGEFAWLNPVDVAPKIATTTKTRVRSDSKSGYRGVRKHHNKYLAQIIGPSGRVYLGCSFETPEEAARAYDEAAIRLRGVSPDSSYLNFPATCDQPNITNDIPNTNTI